MRLIDNDVDWETSIIVKAQAKNLLEQQRDDQPLTFLVILQQ